VSWLSSWPFKREKIDGKTKKRRTCPHLVLAPRWDKAEDIGHENRATGYWCAACQQPITVEEAAALQGRARAKAA